jgi:hypothetical protein
MEDSTFKVIIQSSQLGTIGSAWSFLVNNIPPSRKSYRDMYSICSCCLNVATNNWKVDWIITLKVWKQVIVIKISLNYNWSDELFIFSVCFFSQQHCIWRFICISCWFDGCGLNSRIHFISYVHSERVRKNILIPNVAEKNILILVEGKKNNLIQSFCHIT